MSQEFLSPIGRLVMGSLYKPNTTDMQGKQLIGKDGKPYVEYWIHLAIAKGSEQHWNQTQWGSVLYNFGVKEFPNGLFNSPDFSWKVIDGDGQIPGRSRNGQPGKRPCDHEGYPGHWILRYRSKFAPTLVTPEGAPLNMPEGGIKCGYFIQVYGTIAKNQTANSNGIYLNFTHVAFSGYGAEIATTKSVDPKAIGFGGALPTGASAVPLQAMTPPANAYVPPPATNPVGAPPAPVNAAPPPYNAILQPPKVMLPAANGIPYEEYKKSGWTDQQLIQSGMMQA